MPTSVVRLLVAALASLVMATAITRISLDAAGPCGDLSKLTAPDAAITLAESVDAGAFTVPVQVNAEAVKALPAFCRVAATLKPIDRFGHQDRSLDAGVATGTASSRRSATAPSTAAISYPAMMTALRARLCGELNRHRPHRRQRELRARPSGEGDRLRLARRPRDDGDGQGDHRRVSTAPRRSSRTGTAARPAAGRR